MSHSMSLVILLLDYARHLDVHSVGHLNEIQSYWESAEIEAH